MSTPFGIDLGNNSSVVAVARNRGIDVVVNEVSNRSTPSVIGFGIKNRSIGETGKTQQTSNLKNTVENLKRILALPASSPDVSAEKKYFTCPIVEKDDDKLAVKVRYLGEQHEFSPTQLVAMYLHKLKDITAKETKSTISDICLAVPTWYTEQQRRAASDACKIAGLNPVRIVNEVTAAAVGYGVFKTDLPTDEPKRVAFVDIGHSSYTVSIAALKKGELKVLGSAFDKHFGGRDFDKAITEHFADEFKAKYKIDIRENAKAYSRVLAAAEKLKKVLSANTQAPINIESVMNDIDVSSQLTREELEEFVKPLLDRINVPVEKALELAGLKASDLDSIEVIGGCTRVPSVKTRLAEIFGKPLSFTLNQDEAISRGAAFICAMHSPTLRVRPFKFEDVNSFGVTYYWSKDAEDTDHLEVFPKGGVFPSTKMITLYRTSDFEVEAKYSNPEELPKGTDPVIALWKLSGVEVAEGEDSAICKLKVRNDPSGFFTIESAYIVQEQEVKELIEKEDAEEDAEPEYKIIKKLVKTKDLAITYSGHALTEKELSDLLEKEFKMVADDKLVAETEDRKNALEEYIYELRGKLDDQYKDFASDQEKESLSKKLMDTEEWLYDDGYDASKAKYIAKYEELASTGNLIKGRYRAKQEELRQKLRAKQEASQMAAMAEKLAADRATKGKKDSEGDVKMEEELD